MKTGEDMPSTFVYNSFGGTLAAMILPIPTKPTDAREHLLRGVSGTFA